MSGSFPIYPSHPTRHYIARTDPRGRELRAEVEIQPGTGSGIVTVTSAGFFAEDVTAESNLIHGLLGEDDEDVRLALAALWRLDRNLPAEKEAIVEVETIDGKPKFTIKVRDC